LQNVTLTKPNGKKYRVKVSAKTIKTLKKDGKIVNKYAKKNKSKENI
jgi:ribosomal protein L28